MDHWASRKIETNTLLDYQAQNNFSSLDGCLGMRAAMRDHGDRIWLAVAKAEVRRMYAQKEALLVGFLVGMTLVLILQTTGKQLSTIV